ncbi:hypothetical protein ACOME3_004800 [Neoechinorhynchus agilis]
MPPKYIPARSIVIDCSNPTADEAHIISFLKSVFNALREFIIILGRFQNVHEDMPQPVPFLGFSIVGRQYEHLIMLDQIKAEYTLSALKKGEERTFRLLSTLLPEHESPMIVHAINSNFAQFEAVVGELLRSIDVHVLSLRNEAVIRGQLEEINVTRDKRIVVHCFDIQNESETNIGTRLIDEFWTLNRYPNNPDYADILAILNQYITHEAYSLLERVMGVR